MIKINRLLLTAALSLGGFLTNANTCGAQVDKSSQDSMGALIETAKARFVIDNPSREGTAVLFDDIAPYILINGEPLSDISELEKKSGVKIISLGNYFSGNLDDGRMQWGEPIPPDSLDAVGGEVHQVSFDEATSEDQFKQEMLSNELGDNDVVFIFPPMISNPSIMLFVDGASARKVAYKQGKPLTVTDLSSGQVGPVHQRDFQHDPDYDLQERIEKVLKILDGVGDSIPSVQEQIQNSLPEGSSWNTAETVMIIRRTGSGGIVTCDIVVSLTWTGAGDLSGKGLPVEIGDLAKALRDLD